MASDAITIVAVRGGTIVWSERRDRTEESQLDVLVAELLARVPAEHRRRRWHLRVALGGFAVQSKYVTGLPATTPRRLHGVLQAGAERFFTAPAAGTVIGHVRRAANGVWAAAYDASVVSTLRVVASTAGARALTVLPIAAVLGFARADGVITYRDDQAVVQAAYDGDRRLERVRRSFAVAELVEPEGMRGGTDGERGASRSDDHSALAREAALGAVLAPTGEAMALRVRLREGGPRMNVRLGISVGVAALAVVATLVTPAIAAIRERNTLATRLHAVAPQRAAAVREQQALALATRGLTELATFDRSRRPVLPLLASIARAMPPGSAIIEFRLDTAVGEIVAVAPHAADLLDALSGVSGLTAPTIVGPVTPEQVPIGSSLGAATVPTAERLTIRFQPTRSAR